MMIVIIIIVIIIIMLIRTPKPKCNLYIHTVFILKENIPFLREWIIYHLNLGFTKIYLYDNTGSIGRNGSTKTINKYNFNFDEIITLTDTQIENELNDILRTYKKNIIYIKWQPKKDKGEITYSFGESIVDYIKRTPKNKFIYTAFIDIDEFIYSSRKVNLRNLITECYYNNITNIIIKQKKYTDRFCNNTKVVDIIDTIVNLDTSTWGCKQIINNQSININQTVNMHNIGILKGTTLNIDIDLLRFNHYNVNAKQIEWMKDFYKQDKFEFGSDVNIYKDYIDKACGDKCTSIKYSVNSDLCVSFPINSTTDISLFD